MCGAKFLNAKEPGCFPALSLQIALGAKNKKNPYLAVRQPLWGIFRVHLYT